MGAYELQVNANASCTAPTAPACTNLNTPGPIDGATGVALNTVIHWNADPNATGYVLRVGTALGLGDLVDEILGNQTSYSLSNLPDNAPIFVRVIPFNGVGNAPNCASESFTTESNIGFPACTFLTSPANEDAIVPENLDRIRWNPISNADGYRISINGSSSNANDETNLEVNGTSHAFANNFDAGETVTVTIEPFNTNGNATACATETFTIINSNSAPTVPSGCAALNNPTDLSLIHI